MHIGQSETLMSTKALDSLDREFKSERELNETEGTVTASTSNSDPDQQHQIHTLPISSFSRISNIYPSWSYILPLFIKGLLFPPLAQLYRRLYYRYKKSDDLIQSTQYAYASLAATRTDHSSLPFYKLRLAQNLKNRYRLFGHVTDLALAFLLQRSAIDSLPPGHADLNWHREHMHESITLRYERYSSTSDLDLLLQLENTALAESAPGSERSLWWNSSRANTYRLKYIKTNDPADLENQISCSIEAMDIIDPSSPLFLRRASLLCSAYTSRFNHYHVMDDLVLALFWGHCSLRAGPSSSSYETLATAYVSRYEFMKLSSDIDKAIVLTKQCIQHLPSSHLVSWNAQHNLGLRYLNRGQATRSQADLDMAIEYFSGVLNRFPETSPSAAICAGNLSEAYATRYNLDNSRLEDLELALDNATRCVKVLGDTNPRSVSFKFKLSNALYRRYLRHRNKKDLDTSIHWCNASLRLAQPQTKMWRMGQNHLGTLHLSLFGHTKISEHLDRALELQTEVVESVPPDDDECSEYYTDLAIVYSNIYILRGGIQNRDAILKWMTKAVNYAKPDNPRLKVYKYSLGREYYNRYNRLREEADLEIALKNISEALRSSPLNDPMRATYHGILANIYSERHSLSRSLADEEETLRNYRKAVESPNANPTFIWKFIDRWARFAELSDEREEECIDAYSAAFRILPELFWLGSEIKSRHEAMISFGINDVTTKAVAGCIHFKRLHLAVEFLEQSLSMTFQQLLGLKSDLRDLEDTFPGYAALLESVSMKIRDLTLSSNSSEDVAASNTQSKLVIERNTILEKIRELPGFESFLLPTPFEKLRAAADEGPVIILNTNLRRHWCDALILLPGGSITHAVLHLVTSEDVMAQLRVLKKVLQMNGIQTRGSDPGHDEEDLDDEIARAGRVRTASKPNKEAAFQPLLDWMWSKVVSVVFDVLKTNGITNGRIWWCPTGVFAHLPLHAAGPPSDYIQSYTPNLESLIRARSLPSAKDGKITAIGLSEFGRGGFAPLPSVLAEISSIEAAVGVENMTTLLNSEATLSNTLEALTKASWLHLACHGEQGNAQDPLKSRIILFNNENLELQTIIATSTPSAEFVFLSACETATGDADMSNESLHLAGGMLFAGFKAVIGTLWSINDADGPVVAQAVYSRLFADGSMPSASQTAEALHFAIIDLRKRGAPPHRWAPFIHIGI